MFKYNNSNVENLKYNGNQVQILKFDGTIAWENWKTMTGYFNHKDNRTYDYSGSNMSDVVTNAFDDSATSAYYSRNGNIHYQCIQRWNIPIKIREIKYRIGASHSDEQVGTAAFTYAIAGIKEDASEVLLFTRISSDWTDNSQKTFSYNGNEEFYGIRIYKYDTLGWGWWDIYECQISKWLQKGA